LPPRVAEDIENIHGMSQLGYTEGAPGNPSGMTSSPLVSVIVPCFRGEKYIGDALQSVASQSHPRWEIIVVEDGSHDGTEGIVAEFQKSVPHSSVRFFRHGTNRGVSATRNTGIQYAAGGWIAFLDHDDLWLPGHLEIAIQSLKSQRGDLFFSDVVSFSENESDEEKMTTLDLSRNWISDLFERNRIVLSSVVVSRPALERVGTFDPLEGVQHCEDYDLWLRMATADCRFVKSPETTIRYRQHSGQATVRTGMMLEHEWNVIHKNISQYPVSETQKRLRIGDLALKIGMHFWTTEKRKAAAYLRAALKCNVTRPKLWWLVLKSHFRVAFDA